jgi:hypothetical protein
VNREPVPAFLESALRRFEDALAGHRTLRIRAEQIEVPDVPGPSADELAAAAADPDAPRELKDVARAVAEGRSTWDDVIHARPTSPEVRALAEAGADRLRVVHDELESAGRDEGQPGPTLGR